jgi:Zn-dependent protease with chaperone function
MALGHPTGSGWWYRQHSGGRPPSEREQSAYQDAVERLQAHSPTPLTLPEMWFVVDDPRPTAAVCGNGLMLSRALLDSHHLQAVLAHELGHLATIDARLFAAVNRLVVRPLRRRPRAPRNTSDDRAAADAMPLLTLTFWVVAASIRFLRGGLGLRISAPAWAALWREHEYEADRYAASLGEADDLADFLEIHMLINDHPVPFMWSDQRSHPPTELRIDRLRGWHGQRVTSLERPRHA